MVRRCSCCDCGILHEEHVDNARANMEEEEILLSMADFYKVLSDSTRLRIVNALLSGQMCVSDISALLNLTKSTVSHQLNNLREENLVKGTRKGKEIFYQLSDRHVYEIFQLCKEHILEEE